MPSTRICLVLLLPFLASLFLSRAVVKAVALPCCSALEAYSEARHFCLPPRLSVLDLRSCSTLFAGSTSSILRLPLPKYAFASMLAGERQSAYGAAASAEERERFSRSGPARLPHFVKFTSARVPALGFLAIYVPGGEADRDTYTLRLKQALGIPRAYSKTLQP
eukprot:2928476-Pleurochrysis_carterae.AAC.1